MSKEQTPITAEEWYNKNHKNLLAVKNTKGKIQYPFVSRNAHNLVEEHIYKIMEQYANAKVLEALEGEFSKVDILMFDEDRSSDYAEKGQFYYETEVKPKYK